MMDLSFHPDIEPLRNFTLLRGLRREQLHLLAESIEIEEAPQGALLVEYGSTDDCAYFLVQGEVELTAADGKHTRFSDRDHAARDPISRLLPHRYQVIALSDIRYIKVDNPLLRSIISMIRHSPASGNISGYTVESGDQRHETLNAENRISIDFLRDLDGGSLGLPSLPDVAVRIGRVINDRESSATDIADIILTDPAIAAKVIKAANSALYGQSAPVTTCTKAVVRLGNDVTQKLVLSYAVRELFQVHSRLLRERMNALWRHSVRVAAICHVLAQGYRRFDPEQAMLAGLLHDIGEVALLNYIAGLTREQQQPELIERALDDLRGPVGSLILRHWGFDRELVITALDADRWMRDTLRHADYCDLVIIAQLHSHIGTGQSPALPAIDQVPAHRRLGLGELTPKMSLKIIEEASQQVAQAEQLLNL
ncbi:MAG: hypothetical protein B0D96_13440 [Candidatus Sedimenticola endophacoides]|uniref:Cyclic nucleotide-binding protein n=1 Tax=Candidatus Sedimenticola endophacoides TaxID=2548426 RepID=A0A657Q355_9GAMM|nr:MAG: hypothetical protein B0D94_00770 [Candidatus Sedimenticola endophacoides]OQX32584.1 MAG: hypothetical protein B0D96_13440 [Candidatus Sedimenticola endophacoides]OQX42631.1 MAG: hypothetical protein B0D88_06315 [Candidatus Sedimenticola endophacoides]OQX42908.1 MAG: hypothetical protein B0D89_00320 [Candidatus Sedimenticola endophacoides]OQX46551.1 MAG: hypothetical protein B0D85_03500 [Candidatus Sedimenticola endophacoides]